MNNLENRMIHLAIELAVLAMKFSLNEKMFALAHIREIRSFPFWTRSFISRTFRCKRIPNPILADNGSNRFMNSTITNVYRSNRTRY